MQAVSQTLAYLPSPERRRANWGGGIDSEEESSGETTTGTADTTNEADTSEPLPSQEKEPEPAQNVNTLSLEPAMSPLSETPGTQKIEENFDSLSDLWGMTGDLAGSLSLADGNSEKYLRVNGTKLATKTASKTFEDVPNMKTAKVSFTWYTTSLTSDSQSGRPGITLKSGDTEIISLYMSEWRPGNPGDAKKQAKKAYYSTQDKPVSDETEIKSVELTGGEKVTHAVVISLDFEALEAKVSIDGSECLTTEINSAATKVDTFMINMAGGAGRGKTYDPDMGIDDFSMEYTDGSDIERAPNVAEVNALADVTATKSDYETGFAHYDKVNVTLSDGTTKELEINKESWKPDKDFVENEWGTYVWEADLVLPEDGSVTNPLGLKAKYTMEYMSDFLKTDIDSLVMPQPVNVTRQEWESGSYTHPATVAAKLVNTSIITVPIDQASWTCEPKFDVNTKGSYVWTAELKAPAGNRNHRGLKVSYTMNYYGNYVSNHDYENDFTFGQIDWDVWGKDVDQESGTGGYEFKVKEEDGNSYLYAEVEKSGSGRGSRLDLSGDIVKSAVMEFDWRPEIVNGGHADLLFMSPAAKQNYFTLYADTSGAIHYYTKPDANNTSVIDSAFEGVIAEGDAVAANVGALNEWVTVKVAFDYIEHTAAVTVTSKKDSGKTYTAADIPISPDANGLSLVVMRKPRDCSKSGNALDNIYVDYGKFDGMDIVSVINPKDINMTMSQYPSYQFPKEVTVKLGDGSQTVIPVENWTSVPVFDESKEGVYKWSASLVPGKYTNFFKLNASFTMNYMEKNYVTSVNNTPTKELDFGSQWSEEDLPGTATVILSDGSVLDDAPVGEWHAIREFNAEEEGIYIYGADLAEDERYAVVKEKITPNEYHDVKDCKDELREKFIYDVYYRISYYSSNNNYNGYTRSMEYLNRGVTAVPAGGGILVSWRLMVEEYGAGVQFNVLRNGQVINDAPITSRTNYLDPNGQPGNLYAVEIIKNGESAFSENVVALDKNYMSIPLQKPDPQPDVQGNFASYSINDAGVADVDGDGEYEIVVKWYPSDAFDSGKQDGPSAPTIFDFYEMDGTPLWRLNMGLEMPSGAHWNQFMFYDLDEDGCAEFFIKTSDGTVSYKPNADGLFDMTDPGTEVSYIGDRSIVPGVNIRSTGHVGVDSNEYVTVFNGRTGEVIDSIGYVNQVDDFMDYNDDWGNRASRFNIAIAYLPKSEGSTETIPAVLLNRGYYAKTTIAAYTLRNGSLNLEWNFDAPTGDHAASKGNHNVATGDMDNDGFDEIVIGALAVDHDGSILWVKDGVNGQDYQGHADAIHLTAMNPDKPTQLYVFTPSEEKESTLNGTLSNAATGVRHNGLWSAPADIGRGVAANITPNPGYEYWANNPNSESDPTGAIFNFFGDVIASTPPSTFTTNWTCYWDGDLLSELPDGRNPGAGGTEQTIYKYNWETNDMDVLAVLEGTHTNNSTKNNPSLTADLFGDWREEIMSPSADDTELRIYMTNYETEYMIYTLMQDPVYRNAVANQNTAYNQPPHVGFYLGEDNRDTVIAMGLPKPNIRYTTDGSQSQVSEIPAGENKYQYTVDVENDEEKVAEVFNELFSGSRAEAVKKKTGAVDGQSLISYMREKVTKDAADNAFGQIPASQTKVVDVKVTIKVNGKDVEVTEKNFPSGGVDVTLPYPDGTNGEDFDFVITHLFTMTERAGETESFVSPSDENTVLINAEKIEETEEGLKIHISSASPFAIAWKEAVKPAQDDQKPTDDKKPADDKKPTDDGNDDGGEEAVEETADDSANVPAASTTPKTGDESNMAGYLAGFIAAILAMAGLAVVYVKKFKKHE